MSGDDTQRMINKAEKFYMAACQPTWSLMEWMAAFASSERDAAAKEATERCCKDVCVHCRNGYAVALDENNLWCHPKAGLTGVACSAWRIRSRVAQEVKA